MMKITLMALMTQQVKIHLAELLNTPITRRAVTKEPHPHGILPLKETHLLRTTINRENLYVKTLLRMCLYKNLVELSVEQ